MFVSDLSYEYTSPTIIMVPTICYVFVMNYPSLSLRDAQAPSPSHSQTGEILLPVVWQPLPGSSVMIIVYGNSACAGRSYTY